MVNLLERRHIVSRINNIKAFMAHLDLQEVPHYDCGSDAVKLGIRYFFYDPDGNIIEVRQRIDERWNFLDDL